MSLATRKSPNDSLNLSAYMWYTILPEAHQFFHPHLPPHELERQRHRHEAWLVDLRQYLQEHPVDPREVTTMDQISRWAELRGIPLAEAGSNWPEGASHA